jgi:copper resistance protein B
MPEPKPAVPSTCAPEHAAMGHCTADAPPSGAGNTPPPPAPRARLYAEHGGGTISQVMIDRAEVRFASGRDSYVWDAEARFGGDIDKLAIKTEGEGDFGGTLDEAEVQALWSHAIGPYFDLQAGVRQDIGPGASPTHAVIGIEGLAPYWFDVEGALFLSQRGDVTARFEASYDQRITQRLILQPMAEIEAAFQHVPERSIGSGFSSVELGLRLRYEIAREFAPYVGVAWERKLGKTAGMARTAGEDPSRPAFVAGVRFWF